MKGRTRLTHVTGYLEGVFKVNYTMLEKDELAELCILKKTRYDESVRSKKGLGPRDGYLANAVREYYPDLKTTEIFRSSI